MESTITKGGSVMESPPHQLYLGKSCNISRFPLSLAKLPVMKRMLLLPLLLMFLLVLLMPVGITQTSLGLRTGISQGISARHLFQEHFGLEGIWSFRENGMQMTVLAHFQRPGFTRHVEHLNWYYGLGGHLGYYSQRYWRRQAPSTEIPPREKPPLSLGIDAVIGLSYAPPVSPISFAVDYKPFVDLYRFSEADWKRGIQDLGFSVRYNF